MSESRLIQWEWRDLVRSVLRPLLVTFLAGREWRDQIHHAGQEGGLHPLINAADFARCLLMFCALSPVSKEAIHGTEPRENGTISWQKRT